MLQRLFCKSFSVKNCGSQKKLLFKIPFHNHSCEQCRFRLYSSHKFTALQNNYERTLFCEKNLFFVRTRTYTSQIDAQKKNDHIETLKDKTQIATSKKINVKLKTSELKRLLSLAEPEKWTLTGKYIKIKCKNKTLSLEVIPEFLLLFLII